MEFCDGGDVFSRIKDMTTDKDLKWDEETIWYIFI